jgi:hypothetical protein
MGIIEYKRRRYGWQLFVSPQPEAMRLPKFLAKTPILTEFDQKEPEYGFRYNYFWQGLDLKFYGLHHQNRSPILVPELSSSGLRLRALQRYEKTLAGTFNYAWEYTVLRGELARTMADRQDPRDLSPVQVDQAILELDYTTEEQILLVGQLQSIVPYDCSLLPRCNQRQVWGGAQVQIPWWDSLFRTNFFLYQRLDQKTLYRRTDLEWDTGSNLQLRASHEFYEGFARDGLAFLDIQDRYLGEISYVF